MRNITIKVSDEIYQQARVAAANRNMSVSALFRAFILTIERKPDRNQPDGRHFQESFPPLPECFLEESAQRMSDSHFREIDEYVRKHGRYL